MENRSTVLPAPKHDGSLDGELGFSPSCTAALVSVLLTTHGYLLPLHLLQV